MNAVIAWLKANKFLIGTVMTVAGGVLCDKVNWVAGLGVILAALSRSKRTTGETPVPQANEPVSLDAKTYKFPTPSQN